MHLEEQFRKTKVKSHEQSVQKHWREEEEEEEIQKQLQNTQTQQEIGDDLSVCALNLLSVVSVLPSLVAIRLVKLKSKFFILSRDLVRPPD